MSQIILNSGAAVPGTPASGKGYLYSTNQSILSTVNVDGVASPIDSPRRNYLRNSGFWFAQRFNPAIANTVTVGLASPSAEFGLGPDGWAIGRNLADVTYQRIDTAAAPETGLRSRFYGKFVKTTNAGKIQISQRDASATFAPAVGDACTLRTRTVRFTLYLKSVSTNVTWRMGITYNDAGNANTFAWGANSTDPTTTLETRLTPVAGQTGDGCTIVGSGATITGLSTTAWTRVSCLFNLTSPSSVGDTYYRVMLWSDSAVAVGSGIAIAQASLCDGYEIVDWPHDAVAVELARCQCFYQKTFAVDQIPVQNLGINTGELQGIIGKAGAVANAIQLYWATHAQMMTQNAGIVLYNPAAANALIRDETANVDSGAIATSSFGGNYWIVVIATGNAASAVGNVIGCHVVIDQEIY